MFYHERSFYGPYMILQVAAGGKLFNVVVNTEDTGKQLLQKGDLRRRITIIPLNKIQSRTILHKVQQAAVRLVNLKTLIFIAFSYYLFVLLLINLL